MVRKCGLVQSWNDSPDRISRLLHLTSIAFHVYCVSRLLRFTTSTSSRRHDDERVVACLLPPRHPVPAAGARDERYHPHDAIAEVPLAQGAHRGIQTELTELFQRLPRREGFRRQDLVVPQRQ